MVSTISKIQRHENILLSLKKLGYLSRSQLQKMHRLGGTRNANRILKELSDYLNVVRLNENIYYLNSNGRQRVGTSKVLKKTNQITHYLLRNSLYISFGCPSSWMSEVRLNVPGKMSIIADAVFTVNKTYHIVEVDHIQKMLANKEKIKKYRQLIKLGVFNNPPKFIWVTTTHYRKKQLMELSEGLQVQIYLKDDFK